VTRRSVIRESEIARVAQLNVIEDIECLYREFHRNVLGELRFLRKGNIDLPAIQGPNYAIGRVAVPKEVSVSVLRRSLKRGVVDQRYTIVPASRHNYRYSGNNVGTLVGLIIAVREKIRIGKVDEGRTSEITQWINTLAQIHLNCKRMSRVP